MPEGNTLPLEAFAAQHGQGLSNMLEANPGMDPFFTAEPEHSWWYPSSLFCRQRCARGIVVNVAEMRLYYYPPGSNTVEVLPIGIGQAGVKRPRNWVTAVERKQERPNLVTHAKYATRLREGRGKRCPRSFPPGRITRWGLYALYIGRLYAIHGTNSKFRH